MDPLIYSLIGYNLFDQKENCEEISKLIPPNNFGVFVSIDRHHSNLDQHENVHGCIGYWENNELKPLDLCRHMFDVSKSSTYHDHRRLRFKTPLPLIYIRLIKFI